MVDRSLLAFISAAAILVGACGATAGVTPPSAEAGSESPGRAGTGAGCVVGASWSSKSGRFGMWDEPAIQGAVAAAGATYLSNDASLSEASQAANIERLIAKGATVLIVLAQNRATIEPSLVTARAHAIPVIAYDRLIDDPTLLYVSFDNAEVGRQQARALLKAAPAGDYAFIKGDKGDANSDLLRAGQDEVLAAAVKSGAIRNIGESYTDNWDPESAQHEMETFLAANRNRVDAVLSENDGMAGGVIAALGAHQLAGRTAVSGQDGDESGLHEVALGRQTVDVWKDARALGKAAGNAAVELCGGATAATVGGTADFTTPAGTTMSSILIQPVAVTKDNLDRVLTSGWITKEVLCAGVRASSVPACS
jgi:D-xylose transport system substrate-binding protein